MRNPAIVHCGAGPAPNPEALHLRLGPRADPAANVYLEIERLERAVWRTLPTALHDLIEIASYVYAADQAVPRGGVDVPAAGEMGGGWRRAFRLHAPVRNPALWRRPEVRDALAEALGTLSEDDYEFEFRPLGPRRPLQAGLGFEATPYDGLVEEVMLFSGGLDSLSGAVQKIIRDRRKVLLVHHRSTEKLARRHEDLLGGLEQQAKRNRPVHVPVWMNKKKVLGREFTQRTRSFVYLALAATLATAVGLRRVRFYENGVVSLNLPISAQVVGARATRTTHPAVLAGYARLVGLVTGRPFAVENPFLWETKTQVVERIAAAGCGNLIRHTTSCAHTWTRTDAHPHCGICSQCIDRRFAVLAAGQGEHDPADRYEVDLMTGEWPEGEARMMLAGYLDRANQVEAADPRAFFGRFGEVGRALRHVGGPADETARRVYALYRRHAGDVTRVVDAGIAAYASRLRRHLLPASCLVRIAADPAAGPAVPPAPPPLEPNLFRRSGQLWEVRFDGGRLFHLLPQKGAAYLHRLLAGEGEPHDAVAIACAVARGRVEEAPAGGDDPILDREAITAFQARLQDLAAERAAAAADNDAARLRAIDRELEWLRTELKAAVSPHGQVRTLSGAGSGSGRRSGTRSGGPSPRLRSTTPRCTPTSAARS